MPPWGAHADVISDPFRNNMSFLCCFVQIFRAHVDVISSLELPRRNHVCLSLPVSLSLSLCLPRSSCLTVCLSRSLPSCLHACQPKPTSQASNQPASKPNHLASQPQTIKPPTMNKTSVNGTPIGFYSREGVYR